MSKRRQDIAGALVDNSAVTKDIERPVVQRLLVGLQADGLTHETLGISKEHFASLLQQAQAGNNEAIYQLAAASRDSAPQSPFSVFAKKRFRGENAEQVKPKKPIVEEQKRS